MDKGGNTPLHVAVVNRRPTTVRYLLSLGADVNFSNNQGKTPLHLAVLAGNIRSAKDLLLRGANRNAETHDG